MTRFLSLLAAVIGLLLAHPAFAQDSDNPDASETYYGVACSDRGADWQAASVGDTPARQVPKGQVDTPKGTFVQIFTCVVAGHKVRMNFARWPVEDYHCGLTDDIALSAWVDGVKVVDKREAGNYHDCLGIDGPYKNLELWRVLVNDRMHLTVCDRLIDSDEDKPRSASDIPQGQTEEMAQNDNGDTYYFLSQCTLTDLSAQPPAVDPWFDGQTVKRTPPTLDLMVNQAQFCPTLTPAFLSDSIPQVDDALPPYRQTRLTLDGKDYDTADPDDKAGEVATYAVDIDNDGVADTVTYSEQLASQAPEFEYPGQYSWHSGKTGQDFAVSGAMLHTLTRWAGPRDEDPIRDDMTFMQIEGKFYLYKADNGFISSYPNVDAAGVEAMDGASYVDSGPSRHIYELQDDGTAKELCAWKARKRPEEFL